MKISELQKTRSKPINFGWISGIPHAPIKGVLPQLEDARNMLDLGMTERLPSQITIDR